MGSSSILVWSPGPHQVVAPYVHAYVGAYRGTSLKEAPPPPRATIGPQV
jgi:hypothetical protein